MMMRSCLFTILLNCVSVDVLNDRLCVWWFLVFCQLMLSCCPTHPIVSRFLVTMHILITGFVLNESGIWMMHIIVVDWGESIACLFVCVWVSLFCLVHRARMFSVTKCTPIFCDGTICLYCVIYTKLKHWTAGWCSNLCASLACASQWRKFRHANSWRGRKATNANRKIEHTWNNRACGGHRFGGHIGR